MTNYGTTQRRYGTERPQAFDRATRKVCMDIEACEYTEQNSESGEQETVSGYSWVEVYLGQGGMDYPTVKSKLIEAAYAPKDEFGHLMNAVAALIETLAPDSDDEDIKKFRELDAWRAKCASTARAICKELGTLPNT